MDKREASLMLPTILIWQFPLREPLEHDPVLGSAVALPGPIHLALLPHFGPSCSLTFSRTRPYFFLTVQLKEDLDQGSFFLITCDGVTGEKLHLMKYLFLRVDLKGLKV
ncbi:Hypothetical predicted protein [Podarcis lilfordi]|uniref:Uncharacterized protein n=1 Tax=Podarcis lilfordi TaxID=74358 RepID=A0AA35JUQ7_9SAUR|nr:Hypothetical predicted protein [Podarcis lilfordi]